MKKIFLLVCGFFISTLALSQPVEIGVRGVNTMNVDIQIIVGIDGTQHVKNLAPGRIFDEVVRFSSSPKILSLAAKTKDGRIPPFCQEKSYPYVTAGRVLVRLFAVVYSDKGCVFFAGRRDNTGKITEMVE